MDGPVHIAGHHGQVINPLEFDHSVNLGLFTPRPKKRRVG
jgi:hypothetical protein